MDEPSTPGLEPGDLLAYFFIPLPEPIGLPENMVFPFEHLEDLATALTRTDADQGLELRTESYTSLVVHQLEWTEPYFGVDDHLVSRVHSVLPWLVDASDVTPTPSEFPLAALTLVEAAVLIRSSEDVSPGFDEALSGIRLLQKAYFSSTGKATRLVRREALPVVVMYALGRVSSDYSLVEEQGVSLFHCHLNGPLDADSEVDVDGVFGDALRATLDQGPVVAFSEAAREAKVAEFLRGEYKTAVIYYASAAESLLQTLLLLLMWEEQRSPADAVDEYRSAGALVSRVKKLYDRRLKGGKWRFDQDGPIKTWDEQTAKLRHRAVHAGYEPSAEECARAREGFECLTTFVADRLSSTAVLPRYPRTATILVGMPGLQQRGRWNGTVKRIATDPDEPNWVELFSRWRQVFDLIYEEQDGNPTKPDFDRAISVVVLQGDEATWVRHDQLTRRLIRVLPDTNDLNAAKMLRSIESLRSELELEPGEVQTAVISPRIPVNPVGEWEWDFDLIPEASFSIERRRLT